MDNAITTCNGKVPNRFYYPEFVRTFRKIFVPIAPLWTCLLLGILLTLSTNTTTSIQTNITTGDLGRHGTGRVYAVFHKNFTKFSGMKVQVCYM